jgi:hypothetical protein
MYLHRAGVIASAEAIERMRETANNKHEKL